MRITAIILILLGSLMLIHAAVEHRNPGTRRCSRSETLCGNKCYDEDEQWCLSGNIVCQIGNTLCGSSCYNPDTHNCINNSTSITARPRPANKFVLLLVHGAWHTADIWKRTTNKLKEDYKVEKIVSVNLSGRVQGQNTCEIPLQPQNLGSAAQYYSQVTLGNFTADIQSAIEQNKHLGKIVIISHSLSGAYVQSIVSNLTVEHQSSISSIVFVAAYMTAPGKNVLEYTYLDPQFNTLITNLTFPFPNAPMLCVNTTNAPEIFYTDCSSSVREAASRNLVYEPVIPITTPLANSLSELSNIRQVYIKTLDDEALPVQTQDKIINEQRITLGNTRLAVSNFNGDHTPQLCSVNRFVRRIAAILKLKRK